MVDHFDAFLPIWWFCGGFLLLLLLLSAFWPKYLSGRMALWYFFHGKNSQVHYIRHVCQVRLSRKVNKIIEF